ncbi:DDE-type integrase/transposase/recombinase [Verrucomicrobiota bacterium]
MNAQSISLPKHWPQHVRSAILHIVCLAHMAIIHTRSWCADSRLQRVRLSGKLDRAENKINLLKEEIRIKDTRMARIAPRHRPYYPATERMAILELKAACGWNLAQTARVFQVEPETIASWMKRVDEQADHALVQMSEPVNKFPALVRYIVQRLKVLCPVMGKKRIAEILTRAGLSLCSTTVSRFLKVSSSLPDPDHDLQAEVAEGRLSQGRVITAMHPNHVWHVDLTVVPTRAGFWVPWLPFSLPQVWPFCWWIAVAIDHFSRKAISFALFKKQPTSLDVRSFLGRTMGRNRTKPKYIICDKGTQFWCDAYKKWCKRKKIKPRYGAVGKYGSIAIIERFIRSMKDECTRQIIVHLNLNEMRTELALYATWYNQFRPHQSLHGSTPHQRYRGLSRAPPISDVELKNGRLYLQVSYLEGRKHLPIIQLRKAA